MRVCRYVVFCKGADTSMIPLCKATKSTAACLEHIDAFAVTGLRTLVAAKRELTEAQANEWLDSYNKAKSSLVNRPAMLSACAIDLERDMDILGTPI